MKKLILILSALALETLAAFGQNIPVRDNVFWELNYYNPSIIRRDPGKYVDFYGRYEFNDAQNFGANPLDVAAETNVIRPDHAWQASLQHDGLSYYDGVSLTGAYTHSFSWGDDKEHSFNLGGRLAIEYGRVDFSKLDYGMSGHKTVVVPDLDLGFEYRYKYFHIGFGIKNIISLGLKDKGVIYFRYPRSYIGNISFDCNIGNTVMLRPFFIAGVNQNIFLNVGMAMDIMKHYRLSYSFHGPDLSHNLGLSVDFWRFTLSLGYVISPLHKSAATIVRLGVRIGD